MFRYCRIIQPGIPVDYPSERSHACCRFMPRYSNYFLENTLENREKEFSDVNETKFELLTRKGVFPYDYVDNVERLDESELPSIQNFYNKLNDTNISDDDYAHARKVWESFELKSLGEYSDLYMRTDILLLADVMENFRASSLKTYGLDPAWYYTMPGYTWDCMLKYTGCKLQIIKDIDMVMFVEQAIRGGVSVCCNSMRQQFNFEKPKGLLYPSKDKPDAKIKRRIDNAVKAIRQKYLALKLGRADDDESLERLFKPLTKFNITHTQSGNAPAVSTTTSGIQTDSVEPMKPEKTFEFVPVETIAETQDDDDDDDKEEDDSVFTENPKSIEDIRSELQNLQDTPAMSEYLNQYPTKTHKYILDAYNDEKLVDEVFGPKYNTILSQWLIGNKSMNFDLKNDDIIIGDERFPGTQGLYELIFHKDPRNYLKTDMHHYKRILLLTNAHKRNHDVNNPNKGNRSSKYRNIIKGLTEGKGEKPKKYLTRCCQTLLHDVEMSQHKTTRSNSASGLLDENALETIISKMTSKITTKIEDQIDKLGKKICAMEASNNERIDAIGKKFDSIDGKLSGVVSKLEGLTEDTENNRKGMEKLNLKMDWIQQHSRENSLTIIGIKEDSNDNLLSKVLSVFVDAMKIKCSPADIYNVHRIGKRNENRSRTIVVVFVSLLKKNEVYAARTSLKNSKVFINENLTDKAYHLLKIAKEKYGRSSAWSRNGKIFVRRDNAVVSIKDEMDLV
ncbi:unnamed protein product [Phaedon cochleariae]|uniref:DUF8207 domain-containing protein n=1 Tax=Phaedon cochleariae TaxID=80249 RepID=A0A9N9SDF7_PHACE|nr:unnamed protein product [Phaedon cochleariae]